MRIRIHEDIYFGHQSGARACGKTIAIDNLGVMLRTALKSGSG